MLFQSNVEPKSWTFSPYNNIVLKIFIYKSVFFYMTTNCNLIPIYIGAKLQLVLHLEKCQFVYFLYFTNIIWDSSNTRILTFYQILVTKQRWNRLIYYQSVEETNLTVFQVCEKQTQKTSQPDIQHSARGYTHRLGCRSYEANIK